MAAPWSAGAEVRMIGELHGQETVNVLHFATNSVITDDTVDQMLTDLVNAMHDCVITTLLPAVTSDWRYVRSEASRVYPTRTDPMVATGTPAHVGELGVTSASFLSSLVNIRSGRGGRNGRGRIFLPPAGESEIANSTIDDATLVLLAAFLTCVAGKFMGAGKTTPWSIGVLSRKLANNNLVNFDAGFFEARQLSPTANVACMRSRRKGHGV